MSLFANKMIQALCWTLFHSLWQALLLAFIAGAVIMCTKKSAVVLRYNLLTGLLVAFLLTAAATFYYETGQAKQPVAETIVVTENGMPVSGIDIQTTQATAPASQVSSAIISFLNANSRIIVLAWLCIIAFKCFQLFVGFWGIRRLKTTQITSAGEYWTTRIKELAEMLYIERPIKLVQSAIAKVPMVTGHFKPVILLPMGILTSLPADEIEAILLHELAHIRRRDFLMNVLQSFCDILFFFNPAVLWVSALIKEERENCCDDIAISQVKNKKKFVHALISFQEYHSPELAVTFAGKRQHLLNRVKRILTNNNKTLNAMEKLLLVSGLVVTSFVVAAFTHNNTKPVIKKKQPVAVTVPSKIPQLLPKEIVLQDTVPAKKKEEKGNHDYTITTKKDNKEYRIKLVNDKITELYIDDKKIPDDKIDDYKDEVDDIIKDVKEKSAKARAEADEARERMNESREQINLLREKMVHQQEDMKRALQEMELARKQMRENRKISQERLQEMKEKAMEDSKYSIEERRLLKKAFDENRNQSLKEKVIAQKYLEEAERSSRDSKRIQDREIQRFKETDRIREKAELMHLRSEKQRMLAQERREKAEVSRKKSQQLVKDIMDDLTKEGVVKDSDDDITFTLTSDALYVNGEKQPDALHQKMVKKHLKSNSDHIRYTVTANSSHTDIHIEKQ